MCIAPAANAQCEAAPSGGGGGGSSINLAELVEAIEGAQKLEQLQTAFTNAATTIDSSLSQGDLVTGFQQYLVFAENAVRFQNDVPNLEQGFVQTRDRITVVANYAVSNAKRSIDQSPEDSMAMMTLVEVANMPQLGMPSKMAQNYLEELKDSETYEKTVSEFSAKYQIRSLTAGLTETEPEETKTSDKRNRRNKK